MTGRVYLCQTKQTLGNRKFGCWFCIDRTDGSPANARNAPSIDVAPDRDVPAVRERVLELRPPLQQEPALVVHQPDVDRPVPVPLGMDQGAGLALAQRPQLGHLGPRLLLRRRGLVQLKELLRVLPLLVHARAARARARRRHHARDEMSPVYG